MNKIVDIFGVYDLATLNLLRNSGHAKFCFDLNPSSLTFLPTHQLKEIITSQKPWEEMSVYLPLPQIKTLDSISSFVGHHFKLRVEAEASKLLNQRHDVIVSSLQDLGLVHVSQVDTLYLQPLSCYVDEIEDLYLSAKKFNFPVSLMLSADSIYEFKDHFNHLEMGLSLMVDQSLETSYRVVDTKKLQSLLR